MGCLKHYVIACPVAKVVFRAAGRKQITSIRVKYEGTSLIKINVMPLAVSVLLIWFFDSLLCPKCGVVRIRNVTIGGLFEWTINTESQGRKRDLDRNVCGTFLYI